jgi:hypothetical protein
MFTHFRGRIGSGLNIGAELEGLQPLRSNDGMTSMGVMLAGRGFIVDRELAESWLKTGRTAASRVVRPIRNGRDLLNQNRNVFAIDFTGMTEDDARRDFPGIYNHLVATVKAERKSNRDRQFRDKWWLFGRWRPEFRNLVHGLNRYLVTVETAKHRVFEMLESTELPEHSLIAFGLDDAYFQGVLSSRIHVVFSLSAGGRLGYGNDPRYNKSRCFDPFPFPVCSDTQKQRIRALAEELDVHRKRAQEQHGLELTKMYNVLEKLRAGEALTAKDKDLHDRAMISTLKQLHDDLDAAVAEAYGWPWPMTDAEILERVVALNHERAAEEARGVIRWLRPDYQNPPGAAKQAQGQLVIEDATAKGTAKAKKAPAKKQPWPKTLPEQVRAVEAILAGTGVIPADQLAKRFLRARKDAVQEILDTLATLGRI